MEKFFILVGLPLLLFNSAFSQEDSKATKYRRSSLNLVLIEADNFPKKDVVINAYNSAPFPDKYNKHEISETRLKPSSYPITATDRASIDSNRSKFSKIASKQMSSVTGGIIDSSVADFPIIINKYLKTNKIANKLVAKWFSRKDNGCFSMNLIAERGFYNASEIEASLASKEKRGRAVLADAGEELIKNTFTVFIKMNFVPNEPVARAARDLAKLEAKKKIKIQALLDKAYQAADLGYEKAKEGYSVWTTAYLYRLKWDDSVASIFYNDYYIDDPKKVSSDKIRSFDTTGLFQMEYVGSEKVVNVVTFSLKEQRTEEQIVALATVRNIDAVYAKLQKNYEVFRPKVPLFSSEPITAKIGMKEGLEGGEKFEVLEQSLDEESGLTTYKRKAVIKVLSDKVWDNRYNAGDSSEKQLNEKSEKKTEVIEPPVDRTSFKGKSKKLYSGMLIRQLN